MLTARKAAFALLLLAAPTACAKGKEGAPPSASALASTAAAPARDELHVIALNVPSAPQTHVEQTLVLLAKAAEAHEDKIEPWVKLGEAWVARARESSDPGFYVNAKACADIALGLAPDDPLALDLKALVELNGHDFKGALATSEKVIGIDPRNNVAYGTKSDALLELGQYDAATEAADKMNSLKPNLPSYGRVGYLRWLKGDVQGSLDVMRLALDSGHDPRNLEPYAWMLVQSAIIFWQKGDYAGAKKGFDDALAAVPDYPPALVGKARCVLIDGEAKNAAELLAKAHAASPLVETAWLLGDARTRAGDEAGAKEAYDLVVKDGKRTDKLTLSRFYSTKNRDLDEALKLIEEEKKTRGGIYIDDTLAWALYRLGKIDDAKAAAERALALGTPDPRLLYHAGAIKIAAHDVDEGKKLVKKALELSPSFDSFEAEDAKKLVAP